MGKFKKLMRGKRKKRGYSRKGLKKGGFSKRVIAVVRKHGAQNYFDVPVASTAMAAWGLATLAAG